LAAFEVITEAIQLFQRVLLSSIARKRRVRSGHLRLSSPKQTICASAAERKYSKEEPIAVNVLLAVRLNVLSMLRVSDAKQQIALKLG